eukprot:9026661-Prorocentrum_lima.AAC.1
MEKIITHRPQLQIPPTKVLGVSTLQGLSENAIISRVHSVLCKIFTAKVGQKTIIFRQGKSP